MSAGKPAICTVCLAPLASTDTTCPSCRTPVVGTALATATPPPGAAAGYSPAFSWDAVVERLRGATLGEYDILAELGRGGMAAVFLAHEFALNRKVALKVMSPAVMMGEGMIDRFYAEAVTQANLVHPNIVAVHAVRQAADLHYFVMQFLAGRSLHTVLRTEREAGRHLPIPVALALVYQVGSALDFAHRRGVIHRDVKPGNVMLNSDGDAVVTDFGIAKVAEGPSRTMTGAVVGTPAYMSPEQCYASDLTPASDQYSLAVVAYELITGRPPFDGTSFALMQCHTTAPFPNLRERRPDCPEEVEAALVRMSAKHPEDRFPDLGQALLGLGAEPPGMQADHPVRSALRSLADVRGVEAKLGDILRGPLSPAPRTHAGGPRPPSGRGPAVPTPVASMPPVPASIPDVATVSPAPSSLDARLRSAVGAVATSPPRVPPGLPPSGPAAAAPAAPAAPPTARHHASMRVALVAMTLVAFGAIAWGATRGRSGQSPTGGTAPAPVNGATTPESSATTVVVPPSTGSDANGLAPDSGAADSPAISGVDAEDRPSGASPPVAEATARTDPVTRVAPPPSASATSAAPPPELPRAAVTPPPVSRTEPPRPADSMRAVATPPPPNEAQLLSAAERVISEHVRLLGSRDTARLHAAFPTARGDWLARWQQLYEAADEVDATLLSTTPLPRPPLASDTTARFRTRVQLGLRGRALGGARSQQIEYTVTLRREGRSWILISVTDQ